MAALPPAPKFQKGLHHVVPVSWQKRFAAGGDPGPYYRNVITGQNLQAQGPGKKMAAEFANIVFDEYFRPSDALEDRLSEIEGKAIEGLDRVISTSTLDSKSRGDIAYLLAIQAARYPEQFQRRLDLGRYLAIAVSDFDAFSNAVALNSALASSGHLPGAAITEHEFERLKASDRASLGTELDALLEAHGYEAFYNPSLILDAALPVAGHLLALEWQLLETTAPSFILSDRPVPLRLEHEFSVGLSSRLGLRISKPARPVTEGTITAAPASSTDIASINGEVRSRAVEWICGPGSWVHNL